MGVRKPKAYEKEEAKKEQPKVETKAEKEKKKKIIEGVRGIVRIAEIDIDGTKKIKNALLGVKGIGQTLIKGVIIASGLDPEVLLGNLTDEQIKKLEDIIKNPGKYGIPYYMYNRMFEPSLGEHTHLVSSELRFSDRGYIDLMKKIKCYKGVRHELGLPVRGQRTRASFRKGVSMGVAKSRVQRAQTRTGEAKAPAREKAAAPAEAKAEKKEEKKTEVKKPEVKKE